LELIAALKNQHGFFTLVVLWHTVRTDTYKLHEEKWEANARSQTLSR
jgi:hypothetical protein